MRREEGGQRVEECGGKSREERGERTCRRKSGDRQWRRKEERGDERKWKENRG